MAESFAVLRPDEFEPSLQRAELRGAQVRRLYYRVGALGFLLRVLLWQVSEGTNDIRTWARFAKSIELYGLGGTYRLDPFFNHPPLIGLLAFATRRLATTMGVSFGHCFKLVGMMADLGTALLLVAIWRRRSQPDRAAQAFAGYGCALCAILISGYHGNTDPVYWFLVLAAVYLLQDRKAPLLAGLTLGAALNVKLIPILVVLPLVACCRRLVHAARFALGCAIALVPFACLVLRLSRDDRAGFVRNVFGYTSYREFWGIDLFERALLAAFTDSAPAIATAVENCGDLYARNGSKILLATTTLLAIWQLIRKYPNLDAYAMATLSFCLFLVLASGFGVQYLGSVVPLLFARRIRDGVAVACASGVFIGLIYCSFVVTWTPIFSQHSYFSPAFAVPGFIAWWLMVRCCERTWRTRAWVQRSAPGRASLP